MNQFFLEPQVVAPDTEPQSLLIMGQKDPQAPPYEERWYYSKLVGWNSPSEVFPYGNPIWETLGNILPQPSWRQIRPNDALALALSRALQAVTDDPIDPEIVPLLSNALGFLGVA